MTDPLVSLESSALKHIHIYQAVPLSSKLLLSFFPIVYTESDQEYLKEIAEEGRQKFPPSTTDLFESRGSLREEVSNWSHSKGFTVSTEGSSLRCQRYEEPSHYSKNRKKKPVPEHKRRKYYSPRCSCAFVIKFTLASRSIPGAPPKAVRISPGSQYLHTGGGCLPSHSQLVSLKLTSGRYSKVQLTKNRLHVLVDLMRNTTTPIPTSVFRDIICPLVPESVPLNCNLLFNIKYKIKQWLDKESQSSPSTKSILQLTEPPTDLLVPNALCYKADESADESKK
jgi:hypothetical protein